MPSIKEFIESNAASLAKALRQRCRPIHDPDTDQLHPGLSGLLRPPRGLQSAIITGAVKALEARKAILFGMTMGTGKTAVSISTAHLRAEGRPYSCLIVCPPHLVSKWEREIRATVPDPVVVQVRNWQEWLLIARGRSTRMVKPTFFISPLSTAKLGARWVPAAHHTCSGALACPQCFALLSYRRLNEARPMTMEHLKVQKRYCDKCGSACWQNRKPHKIAPSRIIKKKLKKWFDYVICDEQHTMKADSTIAGEAFSHFVAAGKKIMVLTGTLIAGRAIDLMPTLYRIFPQKFVSRGIRWDDYTKFNERYGRIETATMHKEQVRKGSLFSGKHKSRKKVMPGIMPEFYRDFLADCTIFCTLNEMMCGKEMPALKESMIDVPMSPAMAAEYACMKKALVGAFLKVRQEDPETALRFISTVAETLATWPDDPHGWGVIGYKDQDGVFHEVYKPNDMPDEISPKERRLLDLIAREKAEGRQAWIFCTRNATADRLLKVMVDNFISCAHLTATVSPEKREDWIRAYGPGMDCILSHPALVETGIDFFGYGPGKYGVRYNFATIIHY